MTAKICQQCPGNVFLVDGDCPKCKGGLKRPMAKRKAAENETKRRTKEAEREFTSISVQPHMVPKTAFKSRHWGRTG